MNYKRLVKELHEKLIITQEELAQLLGVSFAYINRWETGEHEPTIKISTGNCQQHINKKTLEDSKTLIPPDNILANYYLQVKALYSTILNNTFQNQKLTSLRDFLLPLLMNGQVTFKEEKL